MSLGDIFKKPSVQAALVGALGGIAPKLIAFIPGFFNNVFPSGELLSEWQSSPY